jgi:hypothetical protein
MTDLKKEDWVELRRRQALEAYWASLDLFAKHALTGLCANPEIKALPSEMAEMAYSMAEAMLSERKTQRGAGDYGTPYDDATMFWDRSGS